MGNDEGSRRAESARGADAEPRRPVRSGVVRLVVCLLIGAAVMQVFYRVVPGPFWVRVVDNRDPRWRNVTDVDFDARTIRLANGDGLCFDPADWLPSHLEVALSRFTSAGMSWACATESPGADGQVRVRFYERRYNVGRGNRRVWWPGSAKVPAWTEFHTGVASVSEND